MTERNPAAALLAELVDTLNTNSRIDREVNRLVPGYGHVPEEQTVVVSTLPELLAALR